MKTLLQAISPDTDEQTIELERALVTAFLEHAPDIVWFKDRDARFLAVSRSKARRHELEPEQLIGRTDANFFSAQHAQLARADEDKIMSSGEAVLAKLERTQFIDGRQGWTEVTKLPLRDESGAIIGTFGLSRDVTEAQLLREKLETAQRNVIDASRLAGMAEVATGVLHNVGNVLTSLNVSSNLLAAGLSQMKTESLTKVSDVVTEHAADLASFVAEDPKGKRIPEFLQSLAQHWIQEKDRMLQEVASLQANVEHIKEIIGMQQAYATMAGATEPLDAAQLMEHAVRMNAGALIRHDVGCVRAFQPVPPILGQRAKVLQTLVNLIRNAKYAVDDARTTDKVITLRIEPGAPGYVRLIVQDNGVGIAPEHLDKLFVHGFTTRQSGHGFGLHSSARVVREMNGTLTAYSAGAGQGAAFTLELPIVDTGCAPGAGSTTTPAPGRLATGS